MFEIRTIAVAGERSRSWRTSSPGSATSGSTRSSSSACGPVAAELVDRLAPGARRRDDLHVAVLLEHLAEEQLHGERVIADRHADRPVHRT